MAIFRAITFEGSRTASKALNAIAENNDYTWIDEVAVLSCGKHGFIRVDSTWAQSDTSVGASAGWGALTGALLGALMGPQGAIAGAIGAGAFGVGTLSALFSGMFNLAVSDPRLDDFAASLKKDTSALVLVSDVVFANEFGTVFAPYGGKVIETEINEHDVEAIRQALKAEKARS